MKLPDPIKTFVTRRAVDALADFHRSVGEQPPTDEQMVNLICYAFFDFLDTFKRAPFMTGFKRHSFTAAAAGTPSMDNTNVLILHAENQDHRWMVGSPSEFPLAENYEQERAIEESAVMLNESEKQ